jgi:hypothetical protein
MKAIIRLFQSLKARLHRKRRQEMVQQELPLKYE